MLAAGAGDRLRPLTAQCPKALCPVANRALVDHALDRAAAVTSALAVNVHHGREQLERHLVADGRAQVSIEEPVALGTAGALGRLRDWIGGRGALVQNADGWSTADLEAFCAGWDGERIRLLVTPGPEGQARFGPGVGLVASLLPWAAVARLEPVPSGLYEVMWRQADRDGLLDVVAHTGAFVDCGTPRDYLRANRAAAAHSPLTDGSGSLVDPTAVVSGRVDGSVVGARAEVAGSVAGSVVWGAAQVAAGESLVDCIRSGRLTVAVR